MVNVIQYTGELVPIERSERRLDGLVDLWLRKNPREGEDGVKQADEAYFTFAINEAPTQEEIEADFDGWFLKASQPEPTLQDAFDALNLLSDIVFGGEL